MTEGVRQLQFNSIIEDQHYLFHKLLYMLEDIRLSPHILTA